MVTTSYRPVPLHHYVYLGESFNYDHMDDELLKEDKQKLYVIDLFHYIKIRHFSRDVID